MPLEVPQRAGIVLMMETLQGSPVSAANIWQWTDQDPTLSRVRTLLLQGWQDVLGEDMSPYTSRKHELSVQDRCLLWGSYVIVPQASHAKVLDELHDGHPGVTRMKGLARSLVWWPGIDEDLEEKVTGCQKCQENQDSPANDPLHIWECASLP